MKNLDISVVIPCYCSGNWLDKLVEEIKLNLENIGKTFEIILVNDKSPDEGITSRSIKSICNNNHNVNGIELWKNVGQHKAICCGIDNSKGNMIVIMDDDFQHPPSMIPKLIDALESSDFDVVIGSSKVRQTMLRRLGAKLVQRLIRHGKKIEPGARITGFVAFDQRLVEQMSSGRSSEPILSTMLFDSTDMIGFVEVEAGERISGESGYSLSSLLNSTLDNYFSINRTPLRRIAILGLIIALTSFSYIAILIYRYIFENRPPEGYSSLMATVLFFGGTTVLLLGFLGEYVSRILVDSKSGEIYSIKEKY